MEEILRNYFRMLDYFVVRGIPVTYKNFPVTDIDIWAYKKNSPISKQITIVDIKNKKTPQALERIFWVYGLKAVVNADSAIVATTERKKAIVEFGKKLDILVFDGSFLDKLKTNHAPDGTRLTDEEFFAEIGKASVGKLDGDWKSKVLESKEKLARGLSFDTCNLLLDNALFFANKILINDTRKETAIRCFYLICAYISICIDYILKDVSFIEQTDRKSTLVDGFAYGDRGESGTQKVLNLSINMVKQYADNGDSIARKIQCAVDAQLENLETNILADYFSNPEVGKSLFQIATTFEDIAMLNGPISQGNLNVMTKSMIGCLLDFWRIERKAFFDVAN